MKNRLRVVTVAIGSALAVALSPVAAQATTTTVNGAAGIGTTLYSTVRYNTYAYNRVSISNFNQDFSGGGCTYLYLRDHAANREIAGTGCIRSTGTIYFKMLSSGSTSIPKGSFTLDVQITGACGGSGCGTMHWSSTLTYNVATSAPPTCVSPKGINSAIATRQNIVC
ncbi:hypothetical protein GCM10009721_42700 [Terrabacter tumescens]|uniref:Uncharacterized protein n=1 Tax=Terrabacter tumescens TaxID=60443 RepID=A0ABQ2IHP2_9MICO|nr:hypothetical protein [Terrabacter tumescens]GGN10164.1 hypothetical protein GCM10009721_42700 [Terrabacter tumescens]